MSVIADTPEQPTATTPVVNQPEAFITNQELLQRLHIGAGKARKWEREGILPCIRPAGSRTRLYLWSDVVTALKRHSRNGD